MPAPYPKELRERILESVRGGATHKATAERFAVAEKTVGRWVDRVDTTGSSAPAPMGGARRPYVVDDAAATVVRDVLDSVPDTTLPELCGILESSCGVKVSPQTMSDTVRRLGYTQKKGFFVRMQRCARM